MTDTACGLSGQVHSILRDRMGFIKEERFGPNTVVTKGKENVVRLMSSQSGVPFKWVGIGTASTGVTSTDASLGAEIVTYGGVRTLSTQSITTVYSSNDSAQFVAVWTFSGSLNVAESGIFNNSSSLAGDMLCRQTFTAIPVQSGDQLTITWKVTATS